jgi:hypothetical protein
MAIVYDSDYTKSYTGVSFNIVNSNNKIENQLRDLNEYLSKYDIGSERKRVYRDEASNIGNFIYYMNMKYMAPCFIIMDGFLDYEKTNEDEIIDLYQYLKDFFESEKFNKEYYEIIYDIKRENSLPSYKNNVKRVLFSYCFKLHAYRARE